MNQYSQIHRPSRHLYDWQANTSTDHLGPDPKDMSGSMCPKITLNGKDVSDKPIVRVYTGENGWIDIHQTDENGNRVIENNQVVLKRLSGHVKLYIPIFPSK